MLVVAALAVGFWMLLLSPKRRKQTNSRHRSPASRTSPSTKRKCRPAGSAREFPAAYQQLVVLGKAVPADDETASLLVQLNRIAKRPRRVRASPARRGGTETETKRRTRTRRSRFLPARRPRSPPR